MQERNGQRTAFIALWTCVVIAKLLVAARLPLFVDEAFYWQEGQHLAWAYSDLPGLTAWTIRLGGELFGDSVLAARSLFVVVSAALPWLVVRIARRESEPELAWIAGCGALVLPLFATLGVLALPDVLMALATLFCLDALTRMLRQVSYGSAVQLALGLAIGALSHYRFIAAIGAGLVALLLLARGRELLRDPRVIIAVAFGAAAWMPLLAWNIENAEAGLRFQLVDRHPWALHREGIDFVPIQAAFVTPLLLVALLVGAWRFRRHDRDGLRLLALSGGIVVLGFFLLGFFADTERVSFHWPLPGYVALLPLLPLVLAAWPRWLRVLTWAMAVVGMLAMLGYYAAVSSPDLRERSAAGKWYPQNFSGWDELATAVRKARAGMPDGTRVVADNFKVGAELGFALGDASIPVLPHALNRAHGRAPQLQLWGLEYDGRTGSEGPALLVVSPSDVKLSELLDHYQALCRRFGALPAPQVVDADGGGRRFLLFALEGSADGKADAECVPPAIAHLNTPEAGARLPAKFEATGWAIKDVAGVERVSLTLDGRVVAQAEYGLQDDWPQRFYGGRSKDPAQPRVGFRATIDASALPPGRYWLGLEVAGKDGSVERFAGQPVELLGE
ncbi:glycosyltransferase family 39 protein [uncultured Luteimonas sp.]|uniref:ArnT family glycosyltransferase n=1 Tax=uncultured Luteimonas sp. TaxID=453144 RepID=UPI0026277A06|nr:glycosyltransferase family 39 protein [uncultured Luteimonas sp.]